MLRGTVTPFIAWPYRVVAIMAKTAVLKPWKLLTLASFYAALNALGNIDLDDEEKKKFRENLPKYLQDGIDWAPFNVPTAMRIPFTDAVLNLSHAIPFADISESSPAGTPNILSIGGPLGIIASAMMNNDPFTGRELFNPVAASSLEKLTAVGGAVAEGFLPTAVPKAADLLWTHRREK